RVEASMHRVLTIHGGKPLKGSVAVRGAKNLVPKAMVAALLGSKPSVIRNVPEIKDVELVTGLLRLHGVEVHHNNEAGEITMDPSGIKTANNAEIDAFAGDSRIPILFCGPLMHAVGSAFIPDLGGCKIGDRSEEHTSELQSRFELVCRLLLERKKHRH